MPVKVLSGCIAIPYVNALFLKDLLIIETFLEMCFILLYSSF